MRIASFLWMAAFLCYDAAVLAADDRDLRTVRLRERTDFAIKAPPPDDPLSRYIGSVAFSPDGALVATAGTLPGKAKTLGDVVVKATIGRNPTGGFQVWNAVDGELRFRVNNLLKTANKIAFSPDGKTLAVGYGDWQKPGEIAIFDIATQSMVTTLRGHAGWVRSLAYSPDGKTLISCGSAAPESQGDGGELWGWDLERNEGKAVWKDEKTTLTCVAFSPNGKWFAAGGGRLWESRDITTVFANRQAALVQIWEAGAMNLRHEITGHLTMVKTVAFSPDSKMLVSASDGWGLLPRYSATMNFWDTSAGERIHSVNVHRWYREEPVVCFGELTFSPDGKLLAVPLGSWNRGGQWAALRLYNVEKWALEAENPIYAQKLKPVTAAAFSLDGTKLAAAYDVGMIKVWDVAKP